MICIIDLLIQMYINIIIYIIIGQYIAITDDGPIIVEANVKPGMNAVQCVDGGLMHKFKNIGKNNLKRISGEKQ